MKHIVLLLFVFLYSGCGVKYPETTNLNLLLSEQPAEIYTNSTLLVHGHDARENPEVIIYKVKKEPEVMVPNITSPLIVITEALTDGLRGQGLQFEADSAVRLELELNEMLATVTKPKTLYNFEAVSRITVKASDGVSTLTKKYNRQGDRTSVSRPKTAEIEKMLNEQLSDIVTQILADIELRQLITNE